MALLPPLAEPRRAVEAPVLVPAFEPTASGMGLLIALAVVVLDQATKTLADLVLIENRLVEVFPASVPFFGRGFGWQLIHNPGGALGADPDGLFGLFIGEPFFLIVTLVVTTIVVVNLPRVVLTRSGIAYGLLLSGAWGNGIDRIVREPGFPSGRVVDFIATRVPDWVGLDQPNLARFNVADMAIVFGFILLLVTLPMEERAREARSQERAAVDPQAA